MVTFWQKIRNLRIHFYALFWVVSDPEVSKNTPQSIFETKIFRPKMEKNVTKGPPYGTYPISRDQLWHVTTAEPVEWESYPLRTRYPHCVYFYDVPNSDSIALLLWKLWSVSARGKKNGTFWQKIRNLRIHFYALFWVVSDPEVSKNTPQSIFETKIFRPKMEKMLQRVPPMVTYPISRDQLWHVTTAEPVEWESYPLRTRYPHCVYFSMSQTVIR